MVANLFKPYGGIMKMAKYMLALMMAFGFANVAFADEEPAPQEETAQTEEAQVEETAEASETAEAETAQAEESAE